MTSRILALATLALLSACSEQQPAQPQQRSIGGQIGDSYKGMLDSTKQVVDQLNEQMQRTDTAVRERSQ